MTDNQIQKPTNRAKITRKPGIVTAVTSGDTVVILEPDFKIHGNPPKQFTFTLLGLRAPALGRRVIKDGKHTTVPDEPWSFASRENLRKLLIGKSVVFRIEHEAGQRHYGEIWLHKESIRHKIVEDGWADVVTRTKKPDAEPREDEVELENLRNEARDEKKGMWSTDKKGSSRNVNYRESIKGERNDDLFDFFEKHKNKKLKGIVEQVRTGTTLRVLLPSTMDNIQILLAGIRSPAISGNDESSADPYAREARFFTEYLLLNRDVTVTIEGIDKYNNFFGSVLDQQGRNVSVNLLRSGLAQVVDWSASPSTDINAFKESERLAQEEKLRIWASKNTVALKGQKEKKPIGPGEKTGTETFTAKVIEIVNAGTITVKVNKGDRGDFERKLSFASITVPHSQNRREIEKENSENEKSEDERAKKEEERRDAQLSFEAKEFLRKLLIGKSVRCVFDYMRPSIPMKNGGDKSLPPKPFWSIYVKDHNVAVDLVAAGYASVVSHGPNEPRSQEFQQLIIAEKSAQKAQKGIHAPKSKISLTRFIDLTQQDAAKSQPHLHGLKKGKVSAIVEYVFTGSRFKMYIPSQELVICFVLQGISVEKPVKADISKADKIKIMDLTFAKQYPPHTEPGNQALHISRDKFFQRDVQIEVDSVDKGGNFVGILYSGNQPYGLELVQAGLAKLHHGSAQRLPGNEYSKLREAEEEAKIQKTGLWEKVDFEAERRDREAKAAEREAARQERAEASKIRITITEVLDGSNFYYQVLGDSNKALDTLMENFKKQDFASKPVHTPAVGDIVAGEFPHDKEFYRAEVKKIIEKGGNTIYELFYVDYGNSEDVPVESIRELPGSYSLKILPAQAKRGRLVYTKAPNKDTTYGIDSALLLRELVWGKELVAQVIQTDDNTNQLVITDSDTEYSINAAMIMNGLAKLQTSRSKSALYERLSQEEKKARESRRNIWEYGDYDSE